MKINTKRPHTNLRETAVQVRKNIERAVLPRKIKAKIPGAQSATKA